MVYHKFPCIKMVGTWGYPILRPTHPPPPQNSFVPSLKNLASRVVWERLEGQEILPAKCLLWMMYWLKTLRVLLPTPGNKNEPSGLTGVIWDRRSLQNIRSKNWVKESRTIWQNHILSKWWNTKQWKIWKLLLKSEESKDTLRNALTAK